MSKIPINLVKNVLGLITAKNVLASAKKIGNKRNVFDRVDQLVPIRTKQTRRRRGKRSRKTSGLEINRAEGGSKSVVQPSKVLPISVNAYGRLTYYYDSGTGGFKPKWQFLRNQYGTSDNTLDVTYELNNCDEFNKNRMKSNQYCIRNVSLSIDYNRVPASGETIPKLMLWTNTDRVTTTDSLFESNVMKLAMNQNGVKNYNTRLDIRNTLPENLGWQSSEFTFPAKWQIIVDSQDVAFLSRPQQEMYFIFGTWKLSVNVLFRIIDDEHSISSKVRPTVQGNDLRISELESQIKMLKIKLRAMEEIAEVKKEENKEDVD
jgi:hypothetical protein